MNENVITLELDLSQCLTLYTLLETFISQVEAHLRSLENAGYENELSDECSRMRVELRKMRELKEYIFKKTPMFKIV